MYLNLNYDEQDQHIGYVNCRPHMSDTVERIKDALEEHFDEEVTLPKSLEKDLLGCNHNLYTFICEMEDGTVAISVTDGWVY